MWAFYMIAAACMHGVVGDGQSPVCQFHEPVCYRPTLALALNKKIELAKLKNNTTSNIPSSIPQTGMLIKVKNL